MSATEFGITPCVRSNPLADALDRFNEIFGYDLRLPAVPEDIERAAERAELGGRHDIAQDLRLALKQTLCVDE